MTDKEKQIEKMIETHNKLVEEIRECIRKVYEKLNAAK